ncbi:MAG: methyltransferase domain-containing protein [Nitrospirae bacterium]|nr:methyltransferase domain-containing protein [Nitrospirota bacterium]
MMELNDRTILHTPEFFGKERDGIFILIDPGSPNWIATDARGAFILRQLDGKNPLARVISEYARAYPMEIPKALQHVHDFLQAALRHGMATPEPVAYPPYSGREAQLPLDRLREFWIHANNSCNLTCTHCLVSSHPGGDPGLRTEQIRKAIDETTDLGVYRYYFTGGEPFLRKDIFGLIEYVTREKGAELILLTNATLLNGERLEALRGLDRERLKFQVSLDGTCPEINDPIRGEGTFDRIVKGLKTLTGLDFQTSVTAVVTRENLQDLRELPDLAWKQGVRSLHLMWPHRRGRLLDGAAEGSFSLPSTKDLISLVREIKRRADDLGVLLDNTESLKLRINGRPGVKFDLSNACWDSLCLYSDGHLYPSAALAGHPPLDMGSGTDRSIRTLWLESPVALQFRSATLRDKKTLADDPYRFLIGGGDIEQSYFFSESRTGSGSLLEEDPYYELQRELTSDLLFALGDAGRAAVNPRGGYGAPVVYHAMGEGGVVCGTEEVLLGEQGVSTLHSNCVLSFDVEKPHRIVQAFYGKAAEEPQPELCCPIDHDAEDIRHIPAEVLERFYGCGSPVGLAGLRPGEVMADLGSGGGIDCFIAAKKVGSEGRVIGIDMTDPMLEVANRNRPRVAEALGYDVVEFRKGYLEQVPVEDGSVDLVTSNCVINLSSDKRKVFSEIWRRSGGAEEDLLEGGGRI